MITFSNVSFRYKRSARPVFRGLNLQLTPGRVYGLLGENGTGKSTLLGLMSGLLRPESGRVTAHCPSAQTPFCRRPEFLREVFLLPEEFELPSLMLDAYVRINAPFYPRFSDEQFTHNLAAFGLTRNLYLGALSMGERKKVFIAFALAANTRLLLMDEPTNGLDIPSKSQFRSVVAQCMTAERTVVISTHQVHDVEQLLDHILILSHSRLDAAPLLLNTPLDALADSFVFETRPSGADTADAFYAEPSVQGMTVIRPRKADEPETNVNLEVLFNAVLTDDKPFSLIRQEEASNSPQATQPLETEHPTASSPGWQPLLRYLHATYHRLPWLALIVVVGVVMLKFILEKGLFSMSEYTKSLHGTMSPAEVVQFRLQGLSQALGLGLFWLLILGGALTYAGLADKRARTTWLMLPATNLRKTCARLIGVFTVWFFAAMVGVAVADGLRMLISLMTCPEMVRPMYGYFLEEMVRTFLPDTYYQPWFPGFFTFMFFFQVLCSSLFRRYQLAWGIVGLIIIWLTAGIVGSFVMPLIGLHTEPEWEPYWFGFCTLTTPACIWLAHRIFCRWQIDSRRFTNL